MNDNKALLVMDMQNGIISSLSDTKDLIDKTNEAITTARQMELPIIFVRVAFSKNFMEISSNNKMFSRIKESGQPMTVKDKSTQIIDELHMDDDDLLVTKQRISAFTGSNLEVLLRSLQIDHLVLTGIATSGVVLSTGVEAFDKDFKLTFLQDAMADRSSEMHEFLTNHILTRYGDVLTVADWQKQ
ncbi:isochorismatase family cysteine hydrolase [Staphylococcus pasteuri]|uniref:cysteine hydrolase family protein n=1 Tax=Staphylococcus pasteuri TaxID=45972 RepID=UPI0030C33F2E